MLMLDAALVSTDQPSLEQRWNRSVEVARVKTLVQHKGRYHTLTRHSSEQVCKIHLYVFIPYAILRATNFWRFHAPCSHRQRPRRIAAPARRQGDADPRRVDQAARSDRLHSRRGAAEGRSGYRRGRTAHAFG